MKAYRRCVRRAVEDATFLSSLTDMPHDPSGVSHDDEIHHDAVYHENVSHENGRVLTLARESQLADDFAFVAHAVDDHRKIMAVSIEEETSEHTITLRIASNTGDTGHIRNRLQKITDTMMLISRGEMPKDLGEQSIFRMIIETDRGRILSRLRSRRASRTQKVKNKPAFPTHLLQVMLRYARTAHEPPATTAVMQIKSQSQRISDLFDALEAIEVKGCCSTEIDILTQIVQAACDFDTTTLNTLLQQQALIESNKRWYLIQTLLKLRRYRRVAYTLALASKRFSAFDVVKMCVATSANQSPCRDVVASRLDDFKAVLARMEIKRKQFHNKPVLSKYQDRIAACPKDWKVHAEIQLLFFYEANPHVPRPRVIRASKSACYLCNVFFRAHGGFVVPATHGRLYEKWLLPDISDDHLSMAQKMTSVVQRYNSILEAAILNTIQRPKAKLPCPNESVVASWDSWTTFNTVHPVPKLSNSSLRSSNGGFDINEDSAPRSRSALSSAFTAVSASETSCSTALSDSSDTRETIMSTSLCHFSIDTIPHEIDSIHFRAGNIFLEIFTDETSTDKAMARTQFSAEIETGRTMSLGAKTPAYSIVSVDTMQPDEESVLHIGPAQEQDTFVISWGDTYVKISFGIVTTATTA